MTYPFKIAFEKAKAHARAEFPKESCGLIVSGEYIACENIALPVEQHKEDDDSCQCQLCAFEIKGDVFLKYRDKLDMVVHSHPRGPFFPSRLDMETQNAMDVPWAILTLDEERIAEPVMWGDALPIPKILGREFMHGVTDCFSLIRDTFRLGKNELAKQDMPDWPFDPITFPDFPRQDNWWKLGDDLYMKNFDKAGFAEVTGNEVRPGDVFLMKIHSNQYNHAGLLISKDLILHHLPGRLSRREPAGLWGRQAGLWLRNKGLSVA